MARKRLHGLSILSGFVGGLERGLNRRFDIKQLTAKSELAKQERARKAEERKEDVLFRQQSLGLRRTEEERVEAAQQRVEAQTAAAGARKDARRIASQEAQEAIAARQAESIKATNTQNRIKTLEKVLGKGDLEEAGIKELVALQNEVAKTEKFEFVPKVEAGPSKRFFGIPTGFGGTPEVPAGIQRVQSTFGQDVPSAQEQFTPPPPSGGPTSVLGDRQQPTFEDAAFKEFEKGAITVERLIEVAPNIPVFNSVEEAETANVPPGTRVVIGGRPAIAG